MPEKKIIIFMPSIEGGGVEKNLFLISNYLSKKFKNLSVISTSYKFKKRFKKKIRLIGPKINFLDDLGRLIKYLVCSLYLLLEILKNKNSLIISFQGNIFAILISKLMNKKVIIRANSAPVGWINSSFKKYFFRIIYSCADLIIVNSKSFKKDFEKLFSLKTMYIYNPLNKKEILNMSKKKINKIFKKKESLKIINIGRLVDQKNQILLLKVLNSLKKIVNFKLIIIGNGKYKKSLENFAKKNNIFNSIKIINYTKNPYPYIKSSDIMIHTAKYEGLPNVLLETQLLKKLIISSNCPTGPQEILCNGKAGILFKNNNHIDLKKKIIFYLKNKNRLKQKIEYGYKKLSRFDLDTNLYKYFLSIKKTF